MRPLVVIALILISCAACADRLIHIPVGKKVPEHVFRLEGSFEQGDTSQFNGYLDMGLTPYFDATIRTNDVPGKPRRGALDIGYNYITPIPDASPGISVGAQDIGNDTPDGRRFYFATTFRVGLSGSADTFTPAEVTLGFTAGKKSSALVGVMFPITPGFRVLAEHDGYRLNSGVEFRPQKNVAVKFLFIGSKPEFAAQVQSKF